MDTLSILSMPLIQEIIDNIEANCCDKTSHHDSYDFLDDLCEVNSNGETKTVLLHKNWNFVVKIPNYSAYPSHNYCELEAKNYLKALSFHVEKALLETAFLCELNNGIQLYVQPRYSLDLSDFYSDRPRRKALEKKVNNRDKGGTAKALCGMYQAYRIDELWFARLVQLYGKRFARSLEKWTQENAIGDLHNCNVGWLNNRPIILDYSGYYG